MALDEGGDGVRDRDILGRLVVIVEEIGADSCGKEHTDNVLEVQGRREMQQRVAVIVNALQQRGTRFEEDLKALDAALCGRKEGRVALGERLCKDVRALGEQQFDRLAVVLEDSPVQRRQVVEVCRFEELPGLAEDDADDRVRAGADGKVEWRLAVGVLDIDLRAVAEEKRDNLLLAVHAGEMKRSVLALWCWFVHVRLFVLQQRDDTLHVFRDDGAMQVIPRAHRGAAALVRLQRAHVLCRVVPCFVSFRVVCCKQGMDEGNRTGGAIKAEHNGCFCAVTINGV